MVDLEVGKDDGRIYKFGAIRSKSGKRLYFSSGNLIPALKQLDDLADGASYILGHNLLSFDLPHLKAVKPDLRLLNLPAIDTLLLSPLAFPRNPYHRLVKHYQDGNLIGRQQNDPVLDCDLTLKLFQDEYQALQNSVPSLLTAWHWLTTQEPEKASKSINVLFSTLRKAKRPSSAEARKAIYKQLSGITCSTHGHDVLTKNRVGWDLAYTLAWLSVSGGNSVMPPRVRHKFPEAGRLIRLLRDTACSAPGCEWCRERHDACKELTRWFGFKDFRPEPAGPDGHSMQQSIVEAALAGNHVLGILPTGSGKSLCYQIPALSRYEKTGALTVVISPLVALMADQVAGMEASGIGSCITINGMLSMPERSDALDRVRLGDISILIISPEQLRTRSLRRVIGQREIGAWVLDEAHCLSRWGHDFRPDYRYIGRFIRERTQDNFIPPVMCLTATAKPDVKMDITRYFRDKLSIELKEFDGGVKRSNLVFEVIPTSGSEKLGHIHQILMSYLPPEKPGGAIIYCATRRQSEEVAEFLQLKGIKADHFHAGLTPETKKVTQARFISSELRAIAATNAFGMGIDKQDVRLVIHADIPGSLENYFQEAGRAGRDRELARCVLLYTSEDVERQFGMSARSRLTQREIHGILKALRNIDRKKRLKGEVVATTGEILREDEESFFLRDSATDDTRSRTAIAWLEEAKLLTREENLVQVFPSSLQVTTTADAQARLMKAPSITYKYRSQLLQIAEALIKASADDGITTDELMGLTGLKTEGIRHALYDLERLGIANNDTPLTAFIHVGVGRSSKKRLDEGMTLETSLIARMRELAPDKGKEDKLSLHLRIAAQSLRDEGVENPLPERIWRIIRSISYDGRGEDGAAGSLSLRKQNAETVQLTLQRDWPTLEDAAKIRREAAACLLEHLLSRLPSGLRGTDLLVETTLGKLYQTINSDLSLKSKVRNPAKLTDRALLWLHEQEIIRLNKGLAIFRPAMTIRLRNEERRGFTKSDYEPLALHYKGQILQIHVMVEFAKRGLNSVCDSTQLATEYFTLTEPDFLKRWLPNQEKEISRQTTPESWQAIVENLGNSDQQTIVANDSERTNMLVLAGPGSGKTKVLVHRIAYLVRVRRQNPRGILALAYNRHAAIDIRKRLEELIGIESRLITVLTCHGLAMRLAGASFSSRIERPDEDAFREVLQQAVALLRGEGVPPEEADEQRERLLAGFRWILVDEYQDIGPDQYALISALAGRTLNDDSGKLTLLAVGDDDQNIYSFNGTSVEFIRRFENDYGPKPIYLVGNYRSTAHIIAASNAMIKPALQRMKAKHPIRVDKGRARDPRGGDWQQLDIISKGRVQILPTTRNPVTQSRTVMTELQRLAQLSHDWDWKRCAVIAREWEYLVPVRAFCEAHDIPVQVGNENIPSFWRLRETRALIEWLHTRATHVVNSTDLKGWINARSSNPWNELLKQAIEEHSLEVGSMETPIDHLVEWLAEWGREIRRRQRGILLLTAHRAKGLEFDHVAVLDGGWDRTENHVDADEPRRLYYVAMTRARKILILSDFDGSNRLLDALHSNPAVMMREPIEFRSHPKQLQVRHVQASLQDVDLGFPGRHDPRNGIHSAIIELSPKDSLQVRILNSGRWELLNQAGMVVGRLAKSFTPPRGMHCKFASVLAIIGWSYEASKPEFRNKLKCDSWEVVIPEFTFEPE